MDLRVAEPDLDRYSAPTRRANALVPVALALAIFLLLVFVGVAAGIFTGAIVLPGLGTQTAVARTAATAASTAVPASPTSGGAQPVLVSDVSAPAPAAGQPDAAGPTTGPQIIRQEVFGDWKLICLQAQDGTSPICSIMQQLIDSKSNAPIFIWRLLQDGKGGLTAVWQTPEAVLLTRGVRVDAGTPKPILVPYESCGNGSCQAVAGLATEYVDTLSKAEKISVAFVLVNARELSLPVSVKGLADGIAALKKP